MVGRAVWLRSVLLVFIGIGALSFCVQAGCSSGTSTGYGTTSNYGTYP